MFRHVLLSVFLLGTVCLPAALADISEPLPTTLDAAHEQLLKLLPPERIQQIQAMKSENEMMGFHLGPSVNLHNSWNLGSPLSRYFNKLGIEDPEDMYSIIMKTFWRRLHGQPFHLEQRVAYYKEYWKSQADPEGGSPRDGAKVTWLIICGSNKGTVHLGISTSDGSFWRYVYGSRGGIEPAKDEEIKELQPYSELVKDGELPRQGK